MISIINKKYIYSLIIFGIVIVLTFRIINKENNYSITEYKLGNVLNKSERSIVYEIDKINNKKSEDYLYKKILINEQTDVETQVKINNNFKYSPTIIDYGKDYYVIEKYDMTLEKLIIKNQFNSEKLKLLLKVLREYNKYKYNIDDIHTNNIIWSNKKNIFGIIDWDLIETHDTRIDNKLDDIKFIKQFIFKRCPLIHHSLRTEYFSLFKNIYNQQINETDLLNTFINIENESKIRNISSRKDNY